MSSETHSHDEHHVAPLPLYFGVFGALLFLTVVTIGVSVADLGEFALAAALIVATMKSALVVVFFMHLKDADRFFSVIFLSSIFFLLLFISFLMIDTQSRDIINSDENPDVFLRDNPDFRAPSGR